MRETAVLLSVVVVSLFLGDRSVRGQDLSFDNYRSAMAAASGLYRSGNLAASRQPLEAAVELATSDREKNTAYEMLIKVYAETGDFEKMFAACEYIVEHATYPAKASLSIRSLISNAHRKNQLQTLQKRYESQLDADKANRTALTVLAAYHQASTRNHQKRAEYLKRLVEIDEQEGLPPNASLMSDLAFAYKLSRAYEQSAELYERTALLDKDLESSCYMEGAEAWSKGGQADKALKLARKAHEIGPDKRAKLSPYRWHRTLGELFLGAREKDPALHHLQAALEEAKVDLYKTQLAELIEQAETL